MVFERHLEIMDDIDQRLTEGFYSDYSEELNEYDKCFDIINHLRNQINFKLTSNNFSP